MKIELLNDKWKLINEKITSMKNLINGQADRISGSEIQIIVNTFTDDISVLSERLGMVLEESAGPLERICGRFCKP